MRYLTRSELDSLGILKAGVLARDEDSVDEAFVVYLDGTVCTPGVPTELTLDELAEVLRRLQCLSSPH